MSVSEFEWMLTELTDHYFRQLLDTPSYRSLDIDMLQKSAQPAIRRQLQIYVDLIQSGHSKQIWEENGQAWENYPLFMTMNHLSEEGPKSLPPTELDLEYRTKLVDFIKDFLDP